jgi:hypothetical protein
MFVPLIAGLISASLSIFLSGRLTSFLPGVYFAIAGLIILRPKFQRHFPQVLGWVAKALVWLSLSTIGYLAALRITLSGVDCGYISGCSNTLPATSFLGGLVSGFAVCLGYLVLMWRLDWRVFFGVLLAGFLGWMLLLPGFYFTLFYLWQIGMLYWLHFRNWAVLEELFI